jgi:hypothetical protein
MINPENSLNFLYTDLSLFFNKVIIVFKHNINITKNDGNKGAMDDDIFPKLLFASF